jgi:hypothetical protein
MVCLVLPLTGERGLGLPILLIETTMGWMTAFNEFLLENIHR